LPRSMREDCINIKTSRCYNFSTMLN
jgi:hypothetical protein